MTYGVKTQAVSAVTAVPAAVKDDVPANSHTSTGTNDLRATLMTMLHASEDQIQRSVIDLLDRFGVKDGQGRKVLYWHPKNGGPQQATAGQRINNARMGVRSGIADVQLYYAGQLYCLELKALKGRLTPEQQSMGHQFREQGAITGVVFGFPDAARWLIRHGLVVGVTI